MKIAQIAPLIESVPPRFYGGTERVVSYLTEALVTAGHDVTLFASADSRTSARLVPCCDIALRLNPRFKDPLPHMTIMIEEVRRRVDEFDVFHFHIDYLHYPLVADFAERTVTTLHGRLDLPELSLVHRKFHQMPLVSISDAQRAPLPGCNWVGTVHHGLPADLLPFVARPRGDYLAFLGRVSPEKGLERAIEIARLCGMPLRVAAKIDAQDEAYWRDDIAPLLERSPHVEFVGEIGEADKAEFLGNAWGLLFAIDWPEPFGLVTIEAMACGTPTIAFARGAVPEVVEHGVSGFVVQSLEDAVAAARGLRDFDRRAVRACFERRFTAERMARDYVSVYRRLQGQRIRAARPLAPVALPASARSAPAP